MTVSKAKPIAICREQQVSNIEWAADSKFEYIIINQLEKLPEKVVSFSWKQNMFSEKKSVPASCLHSLENGETTERLNKNNDGQFRI